MAHVSAKIQTNPHIIVRWREITGDRRYHSTETIAKHIFDNPAPPAFAKRRTAGGGPWGQ